MMYSQKMVAAIKVDGRILRENKEVVMLPFGSEYNILLKNMNTVRALVNIFIDGDDITGGIGLIVYANSHLELERSIRKGNFEKGNRFRFIERTEQIEEHRGIGVEDGLIRIEYKFEKPPTIYNYNCNYWPIQHTYSTPIYQTQWYNSNTVLSGATGIVRNTNTASYGTGQAQISAGIPSMSSIKAMSCLCNSLSNCVSETGITVPGSESTQKFRQGGWFNTEDQNNIMILRLVGECNGSVISRPITVDRKPICVTCGKVNPSRFSFCSQCGTALKVF
jgi:hypothetical protein